MFTVVWSDEARDQLAEIWLDGETDVRREVTRYAATLDVNLRANGDRIGESRQPGSRTLAEETIGVEFQVFQQDRLVRIVRTWRIYPRL